MLRFLNPWACGQPSCWLRGSATWSPHSRKVWRSRCIGKGWVNRHVTLNRQGARRLNEYLAARGLADFLQAPAAA